MMGMMGRGLYSYGGDWSSMPDFMKQMMQSYYGGAGFLWQFAGIFDFVKSVLIIVLLVALIRWVWRKGSK